MYLALLRRWYDRRSARYFNKRFDESDPWSISSSDYENARFNAVLQALQGRRFERALEAGCAEGHFTVQLASIAHTLLAVDLSEKATLRARQRCVNLSNVVIECGSICDHPLRTDFDLITATEILYYLIHGSNTALLGLVCNRLASVLTPNGILVTTNYVDTGDPRSIAIEDTIRNALREAGLTELRNDMHSGIKNGQRNRFRVALFSR